MLRPPNALRPLITSNSGAVFRQVAMVPAPTVTTRPVSIAAIAISLLASEERPIASHLPSGENSSADHAWIDMRHQLSRCAAADRAKAHAGGVRERVLRTVGAQPCRQRVVGAELRVLIQRPHGRGLDVNDRDG